MARRISVEIVGDSRSLERAFARSERAAARFSGKISRSGGVGGLAGAFGVTVGAGALVKGIETAVSAASDLNEEVNKSRVVFGKSSSAILRWSKMSATAFGLSQQQALAAAGAFGAMFETSGLAEGNAASMSQTMVRLAADMASFNNEDPGEMLDRLRSGLAGEAEPLRRFGVLLSENRVKQEAYRLGLARSGATLSEQQKVQARYSLILKDTARQQGDFARTSGGLANQQRILRANLSNTAAIIGKALLPAVLDTTEALNDWLAVPANQKRIQDAAEKTADGISRTAKVIGQLNRGGQLIQDSLATIFLKPLEQLPVVHNQLERIRDDMRGVKDSADAMGLSFAAATQEALKLKNTPGHAPGAQVAPTAPAAKTPPKAAAGRGVTVGQRNTWFDAMVGRMLGDVQDVPTLKGQIRKLREIGTVVDERLRVTRDATRRISLGEVVKDINRQIRGDQQQLADQSRQAAELNKQKQQTIWENLVGWLEFDVDKAGLTKSTRDDLKALERLHRAIEARIKAQGRTLELAQQELDVTRRIRDLQAQQDGMTATVFRHYSPARLDAMLGLGGNRNAAALLAQIGRGGTLPNRGAAFAGAGGVVITGTVNVHGIQDVAGFENAMVKQGRAKAHNRRGAR